MDVFGRTFRCECGKTHVVTPREVVYARDAVAGMPALLARTCAGRRAAVLMDARTRRVAGDAVVAALQAAGWQATPHVAPDPAPGHSPVCDDVTKDRMAAQVGAADLLVPVGAGVVTDLSRWIAEDRHLPFAGFATAASMNGYASASIAGTVSGVKTLIYAHAPLAVAADPEILRQAPWELTASGLGDVLAKPVSSTDWYLGHLLFDDYYCARSVNLVAEIEPLYRDRPEALKARDPEAMAALFQALLLTGVAMNMAETSAPCSGGEHMISHVLDMMANLDRTDHDLHGRQVGVGTILAAEVYRRVLAVESPALVEPAAGIDRAFWGPMADEVETHYLGKLDRLRAAAASLARRDAWDRLRQGLAPMLRTPESIRDCLARADAAHTAEHIRCRKARLTASLLHGHEIRSRFTVLDLARLVGVMPRDAEEIVERWG